MTKVVETTMKTDYEMCPLDAAFVVNVGESTQSPLFAVPQMNAVEYSPDVKPADLTLHQKYKYQMKWVFRGGKTVVSDTRTLIVGCTSDLVMTPNEAFINELTLNVGQSNLDVYTI